ncbi:MAG: CDP-glycerol glycerophosphotransferase family protein [Proteobacteria bacterium]|nr:CDP-glycerol glycerophosphotransferase family protein [Pseudomonadota bacterium]
MSDLKKILFYVERSLHLPFLEPIEEYLSLSGLAATAFSAPEFFPGTAEIPQWGLPDSQIQRLEHKAPFFAKPEDFDPDVTIVADACHFRIPQLRNVINVGHGMICKGAFYTDSEITRRENLSQLLLVPGPLHRRRLLDNVFIPIRLTGFIRSDQLFGPKAQTKEQFCARQGIDPAKRIVLFAPTYNPELSAMHCLQEGIRKVADKDTVLLIKLHNMTEDRFKELYSNIAAASPGIFYLEDADYSGMMHAADLMISDVSSIFIEFLLLDKPIILFNNPRLKEFPLYRAEDIEYMTRDAAVLVNSQEDLLQAVKAELAQPQRRSAIRKRYAMALDHGRDGQSVRRAAEAILDWVHGRNLPEKKDMDVILLEDDDAKPETISQDIERLRTNAPGHRLRISIFGGQESPGVLDASHQPGHFNCNELYACLRASQSPRTVILRGGLMVPGDWPKWLENHFRWNPKAGIVKAMTEPVLAAQCMQQLSNSPRPITSPDVLLFGLLVTGIGQSIAGQRLPSDCAMIHSALYPHIPDRLPVTSPTEFITALGFLAQSHDLQTRLAIDCYMYQADPKARILEQIKTLRQLGQTREASILARTLE